MLKIELKMNSLSFRVNFALLQNLNSKNWRRRLLNLWLVSKDKMERRVLDPQKITVA
jgi:hypothetical protein